MRIYKIEVSGDYPLIENELLNCLKENGMSAFSYNVNERKIKEVESLLKEKFNDNLAKMVSCKMSIKANTYVDKASMERLIDDLRKCKNPYNCPHGRPAIIHFSIFIIHYSFFRTDFQMNNEY